MFDWVNIASIVVTALTAGGWLTSRRLRRKEDDRHAIELDKARAEADALRQRSELDYTKEVLEIYSAHIVQPLKDQIALTNKRLDLYEYAINQAPTCKLYPNCPVLLSVQSKKHNVISPQLSTD